MATATETGTRAEGKAMGRWDLTCPLCGASDGFTIDLLQVGIVTCNSCEVPQLPAVARGRIAEQLRCWEALCTWIALSGDALTPKGDDHGQGL